MKEAVAFLIELVEMGTDEDAAIEQAVISYGVSEARLVEAYKQHLATVGLLEE